MTFSKNQKQLIVLGALLAAIITVIAIYFFKPPTDVAVEPFVAPSVDTRIVDDLLKHPEYRRLELHVELPVVPGRMGRENPFEAY